MDKKQTKKKLSVGIAILFAILMIGSMVGFAIINGLNGPNVQPQNSSGLRLPQFTTVTEYEDYFRNNCNDWIVGEVRVLNWTNVSLSINNTFLTFDDLLTACRIFSISGRTCEENGTEQKLSCYSLKTLNGSLIYLPYNNG